VPYSEEERQAHALLRRYSESRLSGLQNDTTSPEAYATKFVLKLLKKRLFSSPEAFALTLERHRRSLETARRAMPAARQTPIGLLRQQLERVEEEYGAEEEQEEAVGDALEEAAWLFRAPSSEEERLLEAMQRWAEQASTRPDSKTEQLIAWLRLELLDGGQWSERRAIIFTEYRDTQKWLESMLASAGLKQGQRVLTLYGGMDSEERERMKSAFQADPSLAPVRILLATDAASEGIDLQNHCSRLIHFEIPWNPNRMEQRNGRVDRHGQRAPEVLIYHFVGAGYQQRQQLGEEEALAALSVTPFSARALDRGLSALLVAYVRLLGLEFNENTHAGRIIGNHPYLQRAIADLTERARLITGDAQAGNFVRRELERRIDAWLETARRVTGGSALGYRERLDGKTIGLLRAPDLRAWQPFTCLTSLRDVEPTIRLILDERSLESGPERPLIPVVRPEPEGEQEA
jgi:hypothetical protein